MDSFIEELVQQLGSSYDVVVVASKRAKQLRDGARPLVETETNNPLTIAFHEIAEGKIIAQPVEEIPEEAANTSAAGDYLDRRGDIDQFVRTDEEGEAEEEQDD